MAWLNKIIGCYDFLDRSLHCNWRRLRVGWHPYNASIPRNDIKNFPVLRDLFLITTQILMKYLIFNRRYFINPMKYLILRLKHTKTDISQHNLAVATNILYFYLFSNQLEECLPILP